MRALVLVANGTEEIEAVTVIDILRRAHIEVIIAAVKDTPHVACSRNVNLNADTVISDITNAPSRFDAIILPGGLKGAQCFSTDEAVQQMLKDFEAADKLIAAMCASTTAIHKAEVGKGKKVTSYPSFKDQLKEFYRYQETPVVIDNNLITSRGPGTAMAWSLAIVGVLCGKPKMNELAEQLLIMFPLNDICC